MQEEWDKSYEKYFNDMLSLIFNDKMGTKYDHNIELLPKYNEIHIGNGQYNFVDRDGNNLFSEHLKNCYSCENGLTSIINKEGMANLVDGEGNLLCDEWYDYISYFSEGVVVVKKEGKYSAINDKGKRITEEWFTNLYAFKNGFAEAFLGNKHFFIDKEGNHILEDKIPSGYKIYQGFYHGFAVIQKREDRGSKLAFIDKNGKIIDNEGKGFDEVQGFKNGRAAVKSDHLWYFIDRDGKIITNEKYSYCWESHRNIILENEDNPYVVVLDSDFKKISEKPISAYCICGGAYYIVIKLSPDDEIHYFLDENGRITGKEWRGKIEQIKDTNLYTIKNDTIKIVNKYGKPINNETYDYVHNGEIDGVLSVKKGEKIYFLKTDGKYLLDEGFDQTSFYNIVSWVVFVKNKNKHNILNLQTGNFIFDRWLLRVPPYPEIISKHFVKCNASFICIDKDMGDYKVDKKLSGYRCTNQNDSFTLNRLPIRLYDSLVLCHDKDKVYMYDKKYNTYEELGFISDINYDDNFIINQRKRTIKLVYNNKLVDITDYYLKNIKGKKSVTVLSGVNLYSKDEFFQKNETNIINSYKEAEREKARIKELQNKTEGLEQLYELKKQMEFKKKRLELLEQEARYQAQKAFKQLAELAKEKGVVEKQPYDGVIIENNGTKYISSEAMEPGIKEQIDFSVINPSEVVLSGVDLSNTNVRIDPQKTLNKNMSNSNFEGVFFPVRFTFEGIDIRNSHFTSDADPEAMSIRLENFVGSIYNENTTLNGIPIGVLLDQLEEEKDHGSKSA